MKCVTQHETSVKVTISFNIGLETESHPEDIDEKYMKGLVTEYTVDFLKTIADDRAVVESLIDEYEFEEVRMLVDGKMENMSGGIEKA